MKALIFDCDGVLVDTERDGHRIAFNRAFRKVGLDDEWGVERYGELLQVAGGKERMSHYFEEAGWPSDIADRESYIKELHRIKTGLFMAIIESGELPLRAGVTRLIDESIAAGFMLAVCSTSNDRAVKMIIDRLLGPERRKAFSGIYAGDIVSRKKPDPDIYILARERLGVGQEECVVVEDSRNGLLAAKGAGMRCIITTTDYTKNEDFSEADGVFTELGDPPDVQVTIEDLKKIGETR